MKKNLPLPLFLSVIFPLAIACSSPARNGQTAGEHGQVSRQLAADSDERILVVHQISKIRNPGSGPHARAGRKVGEIKMIPENYKRSKYDRRFFKGVDWPTGDAEMEIELSGGALDCLGSWKAHDGRNNSSAKSGIKLSFLFDCRDDKGRSHSVEAGVVMQDQSRFENQLLQVWSNAAESETSPASDFFISDAR